MDSPVRRLFHELADLPPAAREMILAERQIEPEVRAEVESLLRFDTGGDHLITGGVSDAAEEVLQTVEAESGQCGPFRLVRSVGSGGMGAVYLAERADGELQQQVAIKFLLAGADRPAWRERFLRERQLLSTLNHPAIARVIDAGRTGDGRPYLVMEYVDGVPIDIYAAGRDLRDQLDLFLRVCDGVSHAHRHLIIHRDLKPSNILVDAAGQPKLLDFGIAKLLDDATSEQTMTVERLLTPGYASPEQVRGESQTTATDVYSLGAVLKKLASGPIPKDIDAILGKALRAEPEERYASVEAFANDIRAYLDNQPVAARSGNTWYHARKFLRRYWVPVAAASVAIAGLAIGLYIANRQAAVAQKRFLQVRRLANEVLALDGILLGVPGTGKARQRIVAITAAYLEGLGTDARKDPQLTLEVGEAYATLARVQGVPIVSNLGQHDQAVQTLKKAESLLGSVLAAWPQNRRALLGAAQISHNRMIMAQSDNRDNEALPLAREAIARIERLLVLGNLSESETHVVVMLIFDIGLAHKNMHLYADSIRYTRRAVEIARSPFPRDVVVGAGLSVIADALRLTGDLEQALTAIRDARAAIAVTDFSNDVQRFANTFSTLWREGLILGQEGGINLGRTEEAIAVLQQAFDVIDGWSQNDRKEASSRILFASGGRELGAVLAARDPRRALAVYERSMTRLREISNNKKARRGEAQLLAGSAYALRRLHRAQEAQDRIDAAFRLLRETGDYPAERFNPDDEVSAVVRAQADHLAETSQPARAAAVYQELLDKIVAWKVNPENDLSHANRIARIYGALADLYERNGEADKAAAMSARRLEIWRHWDAKLPGNAFVGRHLAAAGARD